MPSIADASCLPLQVIQTPDLFFFCKEHPSATDLCPHQSQGLAELVGQPIPEGGQWQMGLNDFQKFALVVDVDGNSWSSRCVQQDRYDVCGEDSGWVCPIVR